MQKHNQNFLPRLIPIFLVPALLALITGLWAGLLRLGWVLPGLPVKIAVEHGSLMISGFLGTLIALERAAALKRPWMFTAPLLTGTGWLIALALPESPAGPWAITAGSLAAVGILLTMVRIEPRIYTITMAVGSVSWLAGNLLWVSGFPVYRVIGLWMAFLVLTIAGERLELSRVLRPAQHQYRLFGLAALVFVAGAGLSTSVPEIGARLLGAGLAALAVWLVRYDIARRNLRHRAPLTRFIAACLFFGYLWLGLGGVLFLLLGSQTAGPHYDASLHAVFLGFVFSMIFGHAPIILPALTGIPVNFHPVLYLPLVLLHASLALRTISDLLFWTAGRQWGGLLNEVAVLGFLGLFAFTVIGRKVSRPVPRQLRKTESDLNL